MTIPPTPSANPHMYRDFVDTIRDVIDTIDATSPEIGDVTVFLREAGSSEVLIYESKIATLATVKVLDSAAIANVSSRVETVTGFKTLLDAFYAKPDYVAIRHGDEYAHNIMLSSFHFEDFKDRDFCCFQINTAEKAADNIIAVSMVFVAVDDIRDVMLLKMALGKNYFVRDCDRPFTGRHLYEWSEFEK